MNGIPTIQALSQKLNADNPGDYFSNDSGMQTFQRKTQLTQEHGIQQMMHPVQ